MKTIITIFLILLSTYSFSQKNNNHYKSDIDFGNGTIFTTFLDVSIKNEQFKITSPKNADVRMFGRVKAKLGRLLGKSPKKGIFVSIEGNVVNDSLIGQTKIPVFGKLNFKGVVNNKSIKGVFFKSDNTDDIGSINGVTSAEKKNTNYSFLYQKIIDTIQNNIYSKTALESKEWKVFQKKAKNLCYTSFDDIELFLGFNMHAKKLPFTHLSLFITKYEPVTQKDTIIVNEEKSVIFEEKNTTTAYLLIKNFSSSKNELETILPKIVENQNYKNLIIDLRNNGGGGIDAAFALAKYITTEDMEVGYFVTNKLQYSGYQPELFKSLPVLQPKSTMEFGNELKATSGVKLIFKKPNNPVFKGKIYVLTNGRTASTCEPMVYSLKNSKKGTIIGEKTYGGMLAASPFVVSGKYTVMLPIADFYTYDGIRLDKVGVTPDIEVKSEDALDKALELINKNN